MQRSGQDVPGSRKVQQVRPIFEQEPEDEARRLVSGRRLSRLRPCRGSGTGSRTGASESRVSWRCFCAPPQGRRPGFRRVGTEAASIHRAGDKQLFPFFLGWAGGAKRNVRPRGRSKKEELDFRGAAASVQPRLTCSAETSRPSAARGRRRQCVASWRGSSEIGARPRL